MDDSSKLVCFFIGPIGGEKSDDRIRSDNIQKHLLIPAIGDYFEVVRADQISESGSVSAQVIRLLHEADLVVADLSSLNPNVMYELGIRHSFNKPVVQIIDKADALPFDLHGERTIFFDVQDLQSVELCKDNLRDYVNHFLGDSNIKYISPVARVGYATSLLESNADELIGDLNDSINSLQSDVSELSSIEDNVDEYNTHIKKYFELVRSDLVFIKEKLKKLPESK